MLAEQEVVRDHLAAAIDSETGTSNKLNRLIGQFIDSKMKCDELAADIERVAGGGRITR
jgi:hypothetical protein